MDQYKLLLFLIQNISSSNSNIVQITCTLFYKYYLTHGSQRNEIARVWQLAILNGYLGGLELATEYSVVRIRQL